MQLFIFTFFCKSQGGDACSWGLEMVQIDGLHIFRISWEDGNVCSNIHKVLLE